METLINREEFEIQLEDRLAIFKIKKNVFDLFTSRERTNEMESILNEIQYNPKIKALLFVNEPGSLGETVYDEFIQNLAVKFDIDDKYEVPQFCNKMLRFREIYMLDELVVFLNDYKKMCFSLLSADIVTPFFGACFTSDMRFATPDMYFSLAHIKYGLHPSGGLPYFLSNQLGCNKAIELMLKDKITANEALELGIINKIIDTQSPLKATISEILELIDKRSCTLRDTKLLTSYNRSTLDSYFEYERSLLNLK